MNARANAAIATCILATLGMAACADSEAGTPTPTTIDQTPDGSDPSSDTPRVEDPLDASAFLADPCAVLTLSQSATFDVTHPGERDKDPRALICNWHSSTDSSSIGVIWLDGNKNGLTDLYRTRDEYAYFEETSVEGYPAVFNDIGDYRGDGDCVITVGLSDTLAFDADESGLLDADAACARAKQVAAAVIVTVKGAQ